MSLEIDWASLDAHPWGYMVEAGALFYSFMGLAIVCDNHMVPSLDTGCKRWRIPEDVAGATFLAFGSAAPEIIINAVATLQATVSNAETSSLGVSAILGSGMIAFSLIPACCALFSSERLLLKRRPLLRDQLFYGFALAVLAYIVHDQKVHTWEAALLISTYFAYLLVILLARIIRRKYREYVLGEPVNAEGTFIQRAMNSAEQRHKALMASQPSINGLSNPILVREIVDDELDDSDAESNNDSIHGSDDEDEIELGLFGKVISWLAVPLRIAFRLTCPPCEEGDWGELLYPLTFLMSFCWVTVFSFVLSSVVERWVQLSGIPMTFIGLILVSLGAEIPDTIESVTVARRGLGSMAVSNCQGTQVINIAIGLGLPWLITSLGSGSHIQLDSILDVPAAFQAFVLLVNVLSLNGVAVATGAKKAVLDKTKAGILIVAYVSAVSGYGVYLKATGKI